MSGYVFSISTNIKFYKFGIENYRISGTLQNTGDPPKKGGEIYDFVNNLTTIYKIVKNPTFPPQGTACKRREFGETQEPPSPRVIRNLDSHSDLDPKPGHKKCPKPKVSHVPR